MKIHYIIEDCGDGSATVRWYRDEDVEALQAMLDNDANYEYCQNEGDYRTLTLPWDTDLTKLGISFSKPHP